MKTYSDLLVWLIQNKGREAAKALERAWDGPKGDAQSSADTLSEVLLSGFAKRIICPFDSDYWYALHEELEMPDGTPSGEAWQITATFDGETHHLNGTGKLSFLQTLARLGVEADKITA